jgi:hypothetical protein
VIDAALGAWLLAVVGIAFYRLGVYRERRAQVAARRWLLIELEKATGVRGDRAA